MFERNKQFEAFRDKLNANGVMMRCMWEAHSGLDWRSRGGQRPAGVSLAQWKKWPDIAFYSFVIVGESSRMGTGPCPVEKLAIHTAILIDYGENGFGIWLEAKTNKIEDDVAAILGRAMAPERAQLEERLAALRAERDELREALRTALVWMDSTRIACEAENSSTLMPQGYPKGIAMVKAALAKADGTEPSPGGAT